MSADDSRVLIRRARFEDAAAVGDLTARMFRETFGPYTPPDDLASYLAATFSPSRQAAEIEDPRGDVVVADVLSPDGSLVLAGCVYVFQTPAPAVVAGPEPIELKRLYVDTAWHGRGIAQLLMDEAIARAKARGGRTIWLGVWEKNSRAHAFYRKYGFERIGEHIFPVGSDLQTDWIMTREIVSA